MDIKTAARNVANLDRVKGVRRDDPASSGVVLHKGTRIPISRSRRERLEQVLTGAG